MRLPFLSPPTLPACRGGADQASRADEMLHLALAASRRAQVRERGDDAPRRRRREMRSRDARLREDEQSGGARSGGARRRKASERGRRGGRVVRNRAQEALARPRRPDSPSDERRPRDRACPSRRYAPWLASRRGAFKSSPGRRSIRGFNWRSRTAVRSAPLSCRSSYPPVDARWSGRGTASEPWRCRRSRRPTDREECRVRTPGAPHP